MKLVRRLVKTAIINAVIAKVITELKNPKNQKRIKKAAKNYKKRK